jgi:RNA polymerase sigma factor (sigma-70 family)
MSVRSDAELARAWQTGDHTAFAEVYDMLSPSLFGVSMGLVRDRSAAADVVHDTFVRAARRIDGLREPERLRAWLFAILRNEATDWLRRRGREIAEDVAVMSEHLAADLPEPHTELSRSELADVVWSAAEALQQRDREVLELHVRAGLEAGDLADALGVTPGHAAVLLSRMRDRMEKAIGALLIARLGRRECSALDGLLARWDGRFTLEIRSRVTRHVESCPVCTRGRMQLASYQQLAPAVLPLFVVPEGLRHEVLTSLQLVSNQTFSNQLVSNQTVSNQTVSNQTVSNQTVSNQTELGRAASSQQAGTTDAGHGTDGAAGHRAGADDSTADDSTADGPDSWSWRDDGFPEPQPARPAATASDAVGQAAGSLADTGSPGDTGSLTGTATLVAVAGAGLLAAGPAGQGRQDLVAPWSLPTEQFPPASVPPSPGPPAPPPGDVREAPKPPRGTRTGLLVGGIVALLVAGGVGGWKIVETISRGASTLGSPAAGSGTSQLAGDATASSPPGQPGSATGSASATGVASPSSTTAATASTTSTTPVASVSPTSSSTATGTAPVAAAPHLAVTPTRLSFGPGRSSETTKRSVTLTNDGGRQLTWTASRSGAGFSVSPGSGSLDAGRSATVTVTLSRAKLAEGPANGAVDLGATPTGQSLHLKLSGSVNNPPSITDPRFAGPIAVEGASASCNEQVSWGSVAATDDTAVKGVVAQWDDGNGIRTRALTRDGRYYGSFGPFSTTGEHSAKITAYDTLGNASRPLVVTVTVRRC